MAVKRKPLVAMVVGFALFLSASPAAAFCGFYVGGADSKLYNDATQVVLMRDGKTTVVSMQNNYEGPAENFAMVVPVPEVLQEENVKTLSKEIFDKVDRLSAPRLVEYWEKDPCEIKKRRKYRSRKKSSRSAAAAAAEAEPPPDEPLVVVEAEFSVGEYDIVILSAKEATALQDWLQDHKYVIPDGAAPYFAPYVEAGSYFFVAKVAIERAKYDKGSAVLSPLRFHYTDEAFRLPVRLGLINSKGMQDLIVYILGKKQRFELANYPNATIPTNLEVNPAVKQGFGEFYEALLSRTLEESPKSVVTEYSWAANGCDPCPAGSSSALGPSDFATLGADAIDPIEMVPRIRRTQPQGTKDLKKRHLHWQLFGHESEIEGCLPEGKPAPKNARLKLKVKDGEVVSARVSGASAAFATCLKNRAERWSFRGSSKSIDDILRVLEQPPPTRKRSRRRRPPRSRPGGSGTIDWPLAFEMGMPRNYSTPAWVLTRLHARYDKSTLGEDLVFQPANAIKGGREELSENPSAVTESHWNNFQGRYIIRNEWAGPIECTDPVRGRWGGPWSGGDAAVQAAASRNTTGKKAAAAADLSALLDSGGQPESSASPTKDVGVATPDVGAAAPEPEAAPPKTEPQTPAPPINAEEPAGCSASGRPPAAWWLLAAAIALVRRRR